MIDEDSRSWKEDLLRRFFHQFDVDEILKLHIPWREEEDTIAWHYEKTGTFTVRSAYRLGTSLKELDAGHSSSSANPDGARPAWKKLWKLPIPHKVRIFAWKLIHGGLATKSNNKKRGITHNGVCDLCGSAEESEHHAVITCNHALALREAMRECWDLPLEDELSFSGPEWLLQLIDMNNAGEAARLILILWRAWYVRNELTHGGRWIPTEGSVSFLSGYWTTLSSIKQGGAEDLKGKATVSKLTDTRARIPAKCRWQAPASGWIKINTDGAFSEASGEAGIGVIIRNHLGQVILSGWKYIDKGGSVEQVEALACREGLALAAEWAPGQVIVESDCSTVIKYLACPDAQRSPSTFIIRAALEEARKLLKVEFRHIGRDQNGVAHELAQMAKHLRHSAVWRERVPVCVEQACAHDVNSSITQ